MMQWHAKHGPRTHASKAKGGMESKPEGIRFATPNYLHALTTSEKVAKKI